MSDSVRLKMIWLLLFGFVLVYLCPIATRPMIVPDEVRYAEIPREMIATGDWIVPRLNGLPYFEKPVMGYWLNALAMLVFGENAFAVRFPSAVSAGLSALMIGLLMRRVVKDRMLELLAPLVFLTCLEVTATGVFGVLDGMLSAFLTMAMTAFYFAAGSSRGSLREKGLLAIFGVCCGLAFLTKGFLAFAVPVVIVVPYMIWAGRWRDLFPMAVIPILAATLIALPWAIAVHLKAPDYWNYFFWEEHIKRFMADDAQHKAPVWTYLAAFPVAALPWSVPDSRRRNGDGSPAKTDAAVPLRPLLVGLSPALFLGGVGKVADLHSALLPALRHPADPGVVRLLCRITRQVHSSRHHVPDSHLLDRSGRLDRDPDHRHRRLRSLCASMESRCGRRQPGGIGALPVQGVQARAG